MPSRALYLDRDHEMNHDLYIPSGKWEKVKHRSIDGSETFMRIKGTVVCRFHSTFGSTDVRQLHSRSQLC